MNRSRKGARKGNEVTVTFKNYGYYASRIPDTTDNIEKLKIVDIHQEIRPEFLRPNPEFLHTLEFRGSTSLKNLISLLSHFHLLTTLIFHNVHLDSFQRFYGKFCDTGIETLLFYGGDKLSRDEAHIIGYFNKRVMFTNLSAIRFEPKVLRSRSSSSNNNNNDNNISYAEFSATSHRSFSSPHSRSPSPSPGPMTTTMMTTLTAATTSGASGVMSASLRKRIRIPVNDISNSVTFSVLSLFLIKCSPTLRELTVNRRIFLFHDEADKQEVGQLKLHKFVCDMSCPGFEKIINSQRNLKFLGCHNSSPLRPYAFEAIIVGVQRNRRSLEEIRLTHKYVFRTDNKNLGTTPNIIMHDCSVYEECQKLEHIRLSFCSLNYAEEFEIKSGGILNTVGFPTTLVSITINVDIIKTIEMNCFGSKFSEYIKLKYFMIEGNAKTPFVMRLEWIQDVLKLPSILVFEFKNYRLVNPNFDAMEDLRREVTPLASKFILKENSCVYWRTGEIQWEIPKL